MKVQPDPPADVFTYGNGNPVSEVIVEPGDSCDTLILRYFHVEAMSWGMDEYIRGDVCASATGPDACIFTFEWCDGVPPSACE